VVEKDLDCGSIPGIVSFAMSFSEGRLLTQGNLIEPVIIYKKDGSLCNPFLVEISKEVMGVCDIRERVAASVRQFVFEQGPDELAIALEGFFTGDKSNTRCMSLVYSKPSGERTWISPIVCNHAGLWREILVKSGDFYQLYEKSTYQWN
jgi:hypothetical protein